MVTALNPDADAVDSTRLAQNRMDAAVADEARRKAQAEALMFAHQQAAEQRAQAEAERQAAQEQRVVEAQAIETQRRTAQADALTWAQSPTYQKSFSTAPQEMKQHFISAYPEIASETPQIVNKATSDMTGQVAGTEGMVPKQATVDPATGKTSVTLIPKVESDEELTDIDRQRGQMLANNQAKLQDLFGRASGSNMKERARAIRAANELTNGQWSAQNYEITQKAQKDFTGSGQGSQQVASLNTIMNHLKELRDSSSELDNTSLRPLNAAKNFISEQTGNPAVTKYNTAALAVGTEIAKLLKGSGVAAEDEIKQWQNAFSRNMSPAQQQENIKEVMKLITGRVNGLHQQWSSAFGGPKNRPFLTPESQKIIRELGFNPREIDPGRPKTVNPADMPSADTTEATEPSAQPADDRVSVTSPDGKTGNIPRSQLQEAIAAGYKTR